MTQNKIGHKLTTIGTGVEWSDFDINDWQNFIHSLVENSTKDHLDWVKLKKRTVDAQFRHIFLNNSFELETAEKLKRTNKDKK